ncbi:MAM and LDL-receptor class A domain-containing protein 1-like [Anneissia japonica]|uniref:MAM and LDL-receptor class A domain-containing protein 1-like n=1 Tax=Anneissia japonica TaxID=1529436 RepID=UPI001425A234|nr:MAM and LDL-receptor class A domain-containing protein 1-like [Anneissia japonica]
MYLLGIWQDQLTYPPTLQVAIHSCVTLTIARDNLLVAPRCEPLAATKECIIVPRSIIEGLLTALHIRLDHPTSHQLKLSVRRYFFALDLDKYIDQVSDSCHQCAASRRIPHTMIDQTTGDPPEVVGIAFAADVIKHECQLILLLREVVTSYTLSCLIENERHDTLRDALLRLYPDIFYLFQDYNDNFYWIRTSGSTNAFGTGPKYDHTYGTSQGFYLYMETSNPRNYNETGRIWILLYNATNVTCVEWFYHMNGTTGNILNVYIINATAVVGTPAWTEKNNQGNIWQLGQISVERDILYYYIMFEGIVGSSTGGIALDDVRITFGACSRDAQTKCDFEDPYICYFEQDEYDDFDWKRTSGSTPTSGTGPKYDHTYGTSQGSYMYIETSYPRYNNKTARLRTSSYPATNGTCVMWFYHMYGATLNVYLVNTDGTVGAPAWANTNDQGNVWRLGKLSVETKSAFQIVFEGIVRSGDKGDIALDDVRIIDGACLRNETCDVDCLNGGVCVSDYGNENCQCVSGFFGPTCNISKKQCDFEDPHICYFEQDKYDDFDWIRTSGSTRTSATGPAYDHTYGTLQGSYMYIETSYQRYNQTARLWTLSYPATNGTCVKWFYHMYGATVNTMNVYLVNKEGTVGAPAWTNRNNQGNIWRLGKLSVETKSAFQIVFEGIVGSSNTGDIALDDVRIIDGACLRNETCDIDCLNGGVCVLDYGIENCQCMPGFVGPTCNISQYQCDFEDPHICYFEQDKYDDFDWIRRSGSTYTFSTGPAYDHTYGTLQGSYMYIETSYWRYNQTARLWTLSYPATNGTCIKWFYHMYGATVNTLNVYIINTEGTVGAPAWTNRNNQGNIWRLGKLSVETKSAFQIVFEGIVGSNDKGDIALDDVRVIDGACLRNAQNQCDFEDPYICYFEQDEYDDFDWIRTSGSTPTHGTGPAYDHTYGTLEGFYIYIEASGQNLNDTARIWTTFYPATNGTCIQWYYHMYGETVNTLNVYIVNTTSTVGTIAWTNRNNQGNLWRLGQISVEINSTFKIIFEGIVGSSFSGDIALDDIMITDGICSTNDNEAPIITFCPLDAYLLADKANNTAVAVWNSPAATDNSGVPPYITTNIQQGDLLAMGNHLVSVTVKDSSGNINSSCSFNLEVIGVVNASSSGDVNASSSVPDYLIAVYILCVFIFIMSPLFIFFCRSHFVNIRMEAPTEMNDYVTSINVPTYLSTIIKQSNGMDLHRSDNTPHDYDEIPDGNTRYEVPPATSGIGNDVAPQSMETQLGNNVAYEHDYEPIK